MKSKIITAFIVFSEIPQEKARVKRIKFTGYVFLSIFLIFLKSSAASGTAETAENIALAYTAFEASIIPRSYDLNQGDALRAKIVYKNRGNTEIAPEVDFKIKRENATIYSVIFPYPEDHPKIRPHSASEIDTINIPTGSLETGKYKAILKISENGNYSVNKEFDFSVGKIKNQNSADDIRSSYKGFWSVPRIASMATLLLFLFFLAEPYLNRKKLQ